MSTGNLKEPKIIKGDDGKSNGGKKENDEKKGNNGKKPTRIKIKLVLLLVLFGIIAIASLAIYFYASVKVVVNRLDDNLSEGSLLNISGKHFPADSSKIQVYFDNLKGNIITYADNYLHVTIPQMGKDFTDGEVKVAVVANGDTIYAPGKLIVKKNAEHSIDTTVRKETIVNKDTIIHKETVVRKDTSTNKKGKVAKVTIPYSQDYYDKHDVSKDTSNTRKVVNSTPEPLKDRPKINNLYEYVDARSNDYHIKTLGGITNLKVTVLNRSPYNLDNVTVEVSYLTKNESELRKGFITFSNVPAHQSATTQAPDTERGKMVKLRIISVKSAQFDKDSQQ